MLGYLGPNGTFSHQAAMEWSEGKDCLLYTSGGRNYNGPKVAKFLVR